jgi:hypothetical protein
MFLFRIPIVEHQIQKTSVVQPPTMNNQLNQLSFDTIWYLSTESHHILSYHFFIHGSQKISCHKTINININIYIYHNISYHIISYLSTTSRLSTKSLFFCCKATEAQEDGGQDQAGATGADRGSTLSDLARSRGFGRFWGGAGTIFCSNILCICIYIYNIYNYIIYDTICEYIYIYIYKSQSILSDERMIN